MRARARRAGAPHSVLIVLDHLVELFAVRFHGAPAPTLFLAYGRHSAKERAWDRRRRSEVEAEGRRLVPIPDPERPGLAEQLDGAICRRTAIRAGWWLRRAGLVQIRHEAYHDVADRHGVLHRIGRGGCRGAARRRELAGQPGGGGAGAAGEWVPDGAELQDAGTVPELAPPPALPRPPLRDLVDPDTLRVRGP